MRGHTCPPQPHMRARVRAHTHTRTCLSHKQFSCTETFPSISLSFCLCFHLSYLSLLHCFFLLPKLSLAQAIGSQCPVGHLEMGRDNNFVFSLSLYHETSLSSLPHLPSSVLSDPSLINNSPREGVMKLAWTAAPSFQQEKWLWQAFPARARHLLPQLSISSLSLYPRIHINNS